MISYFPYYTESYILYEELFSFNDTSYYSAKNQILEIDYVIKVFPKNKIGMKDRFINEISMLKKLDHPNIAHIYYHFEDDLFFLIVFENWKYTLKDYMKKYLITNSSTSNDPIHGLPTNSIILQILNGVRYVHQCGVVHLNLNLSTIVIDQYGNIKLMGFDYAFYDNNSDHSILTSSLLEFDAPEILLKLSKKVSFSADIWSLGVIFYYLKIGKSPWPNTPDKKEKILLIESGKVNLTSKKDSSLSFILHQMLVVNPEMRKQADQIILFFEKHQFKSQTMLNTNFDAK